MALALSSLSENHGERALHPAGSFQECRELGYNRPRPGQVEAVLQFVSGQDTYLHFASLVNVDYTLCSACI